MRIRLMQHQAPRLFYWMKRLGRYFPFLWRYLSGVCESCGRYAGFESVVSRHGFNCDPCHNRLMAMERAQAVSSPRVEGQP